MRRIDRRRHTGSAFFPGGLPFHKLRKKKNLLRQSIGVPDTPEKPIHSPPCKFAVMKINRRRNRSERSQEMGIIARDQLQLPFFALDPQHIENNTGCKGDLVVECKDTGVTVHLFQILQQLIAERLQRFTLIVAELPDFDVMHACLRNPSRRICSLGLYVHFFSQMRSSSRNP